LPDANKSNFRKVVTASNYRNDFHNPAKRPNYKPFIHARSTHLGFGIDNFETIYWYVDLYPR